MILFLYLHVYVALLLHQGCTKNKEAAVSHVGDAAPSYVVCDNSQPLGLYRARQ